MNIKIAQACDGDIQFIVEADNALECIAINAFLKQTRDSEKEFHLHGFGGEWHKDKPWPSHFNFGTWKLKKEKPGCPACGNTGKNPYNQNIPCAYCCDQSKSERVPDSEFTT